MGGRTIARNFSGMTTEKQKEYIGSMVMQNNVAPMELKLLRMQMQLVAALEGRPWKQPDDKELELYAARKEIINLEARLAAFAAAYIMQQHKEEDSDGQQRIDGV